MNFRFNTHRSLAVILSLGLFFSWGCQSTSVSQRYGKVSTETTGKTIYDKLFADAYEEKNVDIEKAQSEISHTKVSGNSKLKFKQEVQSFIGTRYKYGGSDRNGVDCSGFVLRVFNSALKIKLPHSASAQSELGQGVPTSNLNLGDLVFFRSQPRKITHVGIYWGEGKFVHASTSSGVIVSELNEPYYEEHFAFSRRLFNW